MRKPNNAIFKSSLFSSGNATTRSNHKLVGKFVKRFGILGIGAFVLVALSTQSVDSHTADKSAKTKQTSIDLVQNKPAAQSTQASNSNNESQDNNMSNSSQGNSVSTNVTSNTTNGSSTTNVTVNGKSVSVPTNGYVETNVDNTQVNVSHSQTDQGNSVNLNVSSNSNSDSGGN